eukprot:GHVO01044456.1.p1 GENE.GHVO01044456.1~~GHVO01044456.1.p1  ORF type:complete len:252 (-),score=34.14 GHVO01044456.1:87-842(-)
MHDGTVSLYTPGLVYFDTQPSMPKSVIIIGGLGDTILFYNFSQMLIDEFHKIGYSSIFPFLSSAGKGFGTSSLKQDADDIGSLIKDLQQKRKQELVLLGHSTGCQSILRFLNAPPDPSLTRIVSGGILQAPVSDVDYFNMTKTEEDIESILWAQQMMKDGKGGELMPIGTFMDTPITAERYLSINHPGGDDDYFTIYEDTTRLEMKIENVHTRILMVFSRDDETTIGIYYPYDQIHFGPFHLIQWNGLLLW